ncbi:MAG: hypothetical protein WCK80_03880 [bacterium]
MCNEQFVGRILAGAVVPPNCDSVRKSYRQEDISGLQMRTIFVFLVEKGARDAGARRRSSQARQVSAGR